MDKSENNQPEEDITLTADALKAMGHPLRWKILCTLGNKESVFLNCPFRVAGVRLHHHAR